jgi:hypothetical protein
MKCGIFFYLTFCLIPSYVKMNFGLQALAVFYFLAGLVKTAILA